MNKNLFFSMAKIGKIFVAAIAASALITSCSNEDNNEGNLPEGEDVRVTIGVAPGTRTAGVLKDETDNAVTNFKAFVFAGQQLQVVMTSSDGSAQTETVKTNVSHVYVITNANANSKISGITAGSMSRSTFLTLTDNLLDGSDVLNVNKEGGTPGKVWGWGLAEIVSSDFTGTPKTATKNVRVSPITARVNVEVDDQRTNVDASNAFKITKVQMINVAGDTRFVGGTTYDHTVWYTGYEAGNNKGKNTAALYKTYFEDNYNTGGHYFYAFENPADAEYPTIVSLVINNGSVTRYYPVHFTTTDAGHGVERGNSYQIKFTLRGNATEDPNITTPEEEVENAQLTVQVTVVPWVMVDVSKEF